MSTFRAGRHDLSPSISSAGAIRRLRLRVINVMIRSSEKYITEYHWRTCRASRVPICGRAYAAELIAWHVGVEFEQDLVSAARLVPYWFFDGA